MTITITTTATPTARAARAAGEAMGLTGPALDLMVRAGTPARHAARVAAAREALMSSASLLLGGGHGLPEEAVAAVAAWLATLDAAGVGGRDGLEGAGTARLPGLSALGTGRKQAGDGPAWCAAIAAAGAELVPHHPPAWRVVPEAEPLGTGLRLQGPGDHARALVWGHGTPAPSAWVRAWAAGPLLAAGRGETPAADMAAWGGLYSRATREVLSQLVAASGVEDHLSSTLPKVGGLRASDLTRSEVAMGMSASPWVDGPTAIRVGVAVRRLPDASGEGNVWVPSQWGGLPPAVAAAVDAWEMATRPSRGERCAAALEALEATIPGDAEGWGLGGWGHLQAWLTQAYEWDTGTGPECPAMEAAIDAALGADAAAWWAVVQGGR